MTRDLAVERPQTDFVPDVCVVGAGAAGIVLALELLRHGRSVVMLEGGGAKLENTAQETYRSEIAGLPHRGIHTGRFRAVGGTTTKWGGQILELDTRDFEARPAIAENGWPIAKSELTRHYERALTLEGLANVDRDDDSVWRGIGLKPPHFIGFETYFTRWCPQPDFAVLHGPALATHQGLTLWQHANAVGIEFTGDEMLGVQAKTLTGVEATFRARQYVFCMGAIESSRFFLQPYARAIPWNRSGLLGRHFQDHIDCDAATISPIDAARFHGSFDNVFSRKFKYHPKLRLTAAKQAELGTLNVAGTMNFVSGVDEAMGKMKSTARLLLRGQGGQAGAIAASDVAIAARHLPLLLRQSWRYSVQHRAYNPPDAKIMLRVHCEQRPDSESSITLSDQRDSLGMLRTRLDWRILPLELKTIRAYVTTAREALADLAQVEPDPQLMALDPAFVARCDDSNHHMGGMRMAATETQGLVDTDLRLYGMRNLYVCSAAVFPSSGHSNPTHTLLALAIRLAEHLAAHPAR